MMHSIPPGLYCVPAAIAAITGADLESVIFPALNRADKEGWLCGPVEGIHINNTQKALEQMGWNVRRYKHKLPATLLALTKMSKQRWPGKRLLVATKDHMLAVLDGQVYDTFTPFGGEGAIHPFARDRVWFPALIERGEK